jgi:hypothetical protein
MAATKQETPQTETLPTLPGISPETAALIAYIQKNNEALIASILQSSQQNTMQLLDSIRNPPTSDAVKASLAMEREANRKSHEDRLRTLLTNKENCDHKQGLNGDGMLWKSTLQKHRLATGMIMVFCKKCQGQWFEAIPEDKKQMLGLRAPSSAYSMAGSNPNPYETQLEAWERMLPQFTEKYLRKDYGDRLFEIRWGKNSEYAKALAE